VCWCSVMYRVFPNRVVYTRCGVACGVSIPRVSGGVRGSMGCISTERVRWYAVRYRVFPYRKVCEEVCGVS